MENKTTFDKLLRHYRQSKTTHTQTSLSKVLNVSQRYISQIEKGTCPPPSFEVCNNICEEFHLSPSEKKEFFRQAAIDRFHSVKSNKPFLAFFMGENNDSLDFTTDVKQHPSENLYIPDISTKKDLDFNCKYWILWFTYEKEALLNNEEIKMILDHQLIETCEKFNCDMIQSEILDCSVSLSISIDPSININQFVEGIKKLSETKLKNQYFNLAKPKQKIWELKTSVLTLGDYKTPSKEYYTAYSKALS